MKQLGRKYQWPVYRYYLRVHLGDMKKTIKNFRILGILAEI
jgi:hypothetical protein